MKLVEKQPLEYINNFVGHRRLEVFRQKGFKCVFCGIEATHLGLTIDRNGGKHWDVYTNNLLMNVDHIVPLSKGGSNNMDNLQPSCSLCNTIKGNGDAVISKITNNPFKLKYYKKGFTIGKEVFVRNSYKSVRLVGVFDKITINPFTGRESFLINQSFFHLERLYQKKN